MKAKTVQIHWHEKQPIFAVDFDPTGDGRFATSGGDGAVHVWKVATNEHGLPHVVFLSTLVPSGPAINVVRFAPTGGLLASAGDDKCISIWKKTEDKDPSTLPTSSTAPGPSSTSFGADDLSQYHLEEWKIVTRLRGSPDDIYDLAWSPDAQFIVTAAIDNTARIWNVNESKCVHVLTDHSHFVQGVAWDPLGEFLASQSSDRSTIFYKYRFKKQNQIHVSVAGKVSKLDIPKDTLQRLKDLAAPVATTTSSSSSSVAVAEPVDESTTTTTKPTTSKPIAKSFAMFQDENFTSFFRRLTFTPDGNFVFATAGVHKSTESLLRMGSSDSGAVNKENTTSSSSTTTPTKDDVDNTVYIFARNKFGKSPVAHLPSMRRPAVAIRCNPVFYHLRTNFTTRQDPTTPISFFKLPYRMVYAIATQDTILICDTQQPHPLVSLSGLHYATFTDLAWSPDGCTLMITSSDGFASIVSFEKNELGVPMDIEVVRELVKGAKSEGRIEKGLKKQGSRAVSGKSSPVKVEVVVKEEPTVGGTGEDVVMSDVPVPVEPVMEPVPVAVVVKQELQEVKQEIKSPLQPTEQVPTSTAPAKKRIQPTFIRSLPN